MPPPFRAELLETTRCPAGFIYFPSYSYLGQESSFFYVNLLKENQMKLLDLGLSSGIRLEDYFSRESKGRIVPEMHYNARGCKVVAEEIGEWLVQEGLWE